MVNLIADPAAYYVPKMVKACRRRRKWRTGDGLKGGGNMAAVHLSNAVGGNLFLGFISAVAFATILAVVAGLTLSGASAVSHDLYASVWRHGNVDSATELRVSKITTVILGIVAVALGIVFEKENVAYMVMLAFTVACSGNFPVLFMSVLWKDCTTKGAVAGGSVGLILAVVLTIGSASVWEAVLKYPKGSAWFPYNSAALFSMTRCVLRDLPGFEAGQQRAGQEGARAVPEPADPLGNRRRRLWCFRSLSKRFCSNKKGQPAGWPFLWVRTALRS